MKAPQKAQSPGATGQSADETKDTAIFAPAGPADKSFAKMRAMFALRGHCLTRSHRADDGRITYTVSRWGQSRVFSHWHDVCAFLLQIGERP